MSLYKVIKKIPFSLIFFISVTILLSWIGYKDITGSIKNKRMCESEIKGLYLEDNRGTAICVINNTLIKMEESR